MTVKSNRAWRLDCEALQQQLAEREKQAVALCDALRTIANLRNLGKIEPEVVAFEALTSTDDLSDYILCDAKPVFLFRRKGVSKDFCTCDEKRFLELSGMPNQFETKTLYKAKEK